MTLDWGHQSNADDSFGKSCFYPKLRNINEFSPFNWSNVLFKIRLKKKKTLYSSSLILWNYRNFEIILFLPIQLPDFLLVSHQQRCPKYLLSYNKKEKSENTLKTFVFLLSHYDRSLSFCHTKFWRWFANLIDAFFCLSLHINKNVAYPQIVTSFLVFLLWIVYCHFVNFFFFGTQKWQ